MLQFWIYCLLKASHQVHESPDAWDRRILQPGQFIFGRRVAAKETGLSERSIRTCLNKLKATREVTIEVTRRYSVVSIVRWANYQLPLETNDPLNDPLNDQVPTHLRPTCDPLATTDKNVKNGNNEKKEDEFPIEALTPPAKPRIDPQDAAVAHVRTAYLMWRKDIVKDAVQTLWTMPTSWTPKIVETFRQRGLEFIELVTPELLAEAKVYAKQYWSWQMVERYLDSDERRKRTSRPGPALPVEADPATEAYNAWLHKLSTKEKQDIVNTARKAKRNISFDEALRTHWKENVEKSNGK